MHGGIHDAGDIQSLFERPMADLRPVDRYEY
jgi:hypothetical protein